MEEDSLKDKSRDGEGERSSDGELTFRVKFITVGLREREMQMGDGWMEWTKKCLPQE